jgi:hypothetical protein
MTSKTIAQWYWTWCVHRVAYRHTTRCPRHLSRSRGYCPLTCHPPSPTQTNHTYARQVGIAQCHCRCSSITMTVVHNAQHWHVESNTHPPLKGLLHCGNLLGSTCDWPMALAKMRVSGSQLWIDIVARWYSSAPGAQVSVPVASLQSRSHWQPQREGSLTRSVGGGRGGGGRREGRHGERVRVRCRDMVPRWYNSAPGAHVSVNVASVQLRSHWQPQREGSFTRSEDKEGWMGVSGTKG